jgi:hypothetical protein
MGSMMRRATMAAAFLGLAVAASAARAASLPPGGDVVPTLMADDPNSSTEIADTGVKNFNVTLNGVTMMGFSRSSVRSNYASNPFGPDALTFIYQVGLYTASTDGLSIASLIVSSFAGVETDVGFYQEVGLVDPIQATRTADAGEFISFNFADDALAAGAETSIMVVNTNARSYYDGVLEIQGGATLAIPSYGAAPLVPEPASIVGAATGLAMLGALGVRRRLRSTRGA